MVLAYDILPENIKSMRPKSVKQTRKLKQPLIVVPVRFFSDDTYIWIKSADLKILSKPEIDAFLSKRSSGKKDTLVDAYKLAENPPDMDEFNRWGSSGPPPEIPDSTEDLYGEEDEPPRKKLKIRISVKKVTAPKKETKKASSKLKAASKPKLAKKALKPRNESEDPGYANYEQFERDLDEAESDEDPEYDSDWGLDEESFDFETGDFVYDDQKQQRQFALDFPRAKDLAKTLAYYNKQLQTKHKDIAPHLLSDDDMNEKELLGDLREVEKLVALGEVPMIAFTKSPLFRALLVTVHKPEEKFPHKQVRTEIEKILKLVAIKPCKLTIEDLVVPTPEETPAETPGVTPGPEVKTEAENGLSTESVAEGITEGITEGVTEGVTDDGLDHETLKLENGHNGQTIKEDGEAEAE